MAFELTSLRRPTHTSRWRDATIFESLTASTMDPCIEPTPAQAALYARLLRRFGQSPEWEALTRFRRFERMSPHRAAHFIQRLLERLVGQKATVSCGCRGHDFAATAQKRPDDSRDVSAAPIA